MKQKTRCPNCNSTMVYFRINKNELVCRSCGQVNTPPSSNSTPLNTPTGDFHGSLCVSETLDNNEDGDLNHEDEGDGGAQRK